MIVYFAGSHKRKLAEEPNQVHAYSQWGILLSYKDVYENKDKKDLEWLKNWLPQKE